MDRSKRLWGPSNGKNELAHSSLEGLPINPNVRALGPPVKREALSDPLVEVRRNPVYPVYPVKFFSL
jgi:hypothetical protein